MKKAKSPDGDIESATQSPKLIAISRLKCGLEDSETPLFASQPVI